MHNCRPNNSESFRLNLGASSGGGGNGGGYLLALRSLLVLPNYREDAQIRYRLPNVTSQKWYDYAPAIMCTISDLSRKNAIQITSKVSRNSALLVNEEGSIYPKSYILKTGRSGGSLGE